MWRSVKNHVSTFRQNVGCEQHRFYHHDFQLLPHIFDARQKGKIDRHRMRIDPLPTIWRVKSDLLHCGRVLIASIHPSTLAFASRLLPSNSITQIMQMCTACLYTWTAAVCVYLHSLYLRASKVRSVLRLCRKTTWKIYVPGSSILFHFGTTDKAIYGCFFRAKHKELLINIRR